MASGRFRADVHVKVTFHEATSRNIILKIPRTGEWEGVWYIVSDASNSRLYLKGKEDINNDAILASKKKIAAIRLY